MLLTLLISVTLTALPVDDSLVGDLNSPIYAVRDKAIETLRTNYAQDAAGAQKATQLLTSLHLEPGDDAHEVAEACHRQGLNSNLTPDMIQYISHPNSLVRVRVSIDPYWTLRCTFKDGLLFNTEVVPPVITGAPPADYTGIWRTYLANGVKESEIYYVRGKAIGPLVDAPIPFMQSREYSTQFREKFEIIDKPSPPPTQH